MEIWKPQPPEIVLSWLEAIVDEAQDELNDWENNFIDSIEMRIRNRWPLTESQEKKLEQIYAEKTK
jgi:hypothetical protein